MQQVTISKAILNEPGYLGERFSKPMAWIDLQLLAEDGQVTASYRELASRWKWSTSKVIRFLDELESKRFAKRSVDTFKGCLTKQLITILSAGYDASKDNDETFRETFQKGSPFRPSPSSPNPPAPPYTPSTTPPISPSKNSTQNVQDASAYAREESTQPPTPFPYPAPFILSSMEREMCRLGRWTEPQFKRNHLEANLRVIASQVGMDEAEQKRFLDYWCQPLDTSPTDILAQKSGAFDLRYRAEKWMEKNKTTQAQQPKSRMEKYAKTSQRLTGIINGLFADSEPESTTGLTIPPDEQ